MHKKKLRQTRTLVQAHEIRACKTHATSDFYKFNSIARKKSALCVLAPLRTDKWFCWVVWPWLDVEVEGIPHAPCLWCACRWWSIVRVGVCVCNDRRLRSLAKLTASSAQPTKLSNSATVDQSGSSYPRNTPLLNTIPLAVVHRVYSRFHSVNWI